MRDFMCAFAHAWPWMQTVSLLCSSVKNEWSWDSANTRQSSHCFYDLCVYIYKKNKQMKAEKQNIFSQRCEMKTTVSSAAQVYLVALHSWDSVMDPAASCLRHLSHIADAGVSPLSAQTDTRGHEGWWAVSGSIKDLRGHPWKMKPSLNR